ncbi:MAG: NADH-quinone oxidoreductase subunit N [Caldilineaceae bacterium]|nr:NADH-quinone oxidoreductase subunit N [Caldilineaceae bacterium]
METTLDLSTLNLAVVLPELTLIVFAILVMAADVFATPKNPAPRQWTPWIALAGVVAAAIVNLSVSGREVTLFQGAAILDKFAVGLNYIILLATGLGILLSVKYIPRINKQVGEYYALTLLTATGMMMMGAALDLITLFLALEIFSLALYILSGLNRTSPRSTEAAIKYFLLGAFSSSFFAYGGALIYAGTGTTQYYGIAQVTAAGLANTPLLYAGIALLVAGFGFKVSLVPFHSWTPDVYQGAPTPVTAFMSVGTKAAAFAAFFRVMLVALPFSYGAWSMPLALLAVITMAVGNFAALQQRSLKRMLAYSSIAHAGYILTALAGGAAEGADAALFYLFTYAFMNIGAFAVVMALEEMGAEDAMQDRAKGLGKTHPIMAFLMAIFMFGLSGMPPLAGFYGKILLFEAAVAGGMIWLAIVAVAFTAVGAVYYLRVIANMYFADPVDESADEVNRSLPLDVGLAIAVAGTILVGVFPGFWMNAFQQSMALFGG